MNQAQSGSTTNTLSAQYQSIAPWTLSSVLLVDAAVNLHGFLQQLPPSCLLAGVLQAGELDPLQFRGVLDEGMACGARGERPAMCGLAGPMSESFSWSHSVSWGQNFDSSEFGQGCGPHAKA